MLLCDVGKVTPGAGIVEERYVKTQRVKAKALSIVRIRGRLLDTVGQQPPDEQAEVGQVGPRLPNAGELQARPACWTLALKLRSLAGTGHESHIGRVGQRVKCRGNEHRIAQLF